MEYQGLLLEMWNLFIEKKMFSVLLPLKFTYYQHIKSSPLETERMKWNAENPLNSYQLLGMFEMNGFHHGNEPKSRKKTR